MAHQTAEVKLKYERCETGTGAADVHTSPEIKLKSTGNVFVVPFELTTAISLFSVNLSFGGGADFAFGSGNLDASVTSPVYNQSDTKVGSLSISDVATKNTNPRFCNPKFMVGLGLSFFVTKINIPLVYYTKTKATSIGFYLGFSY